MGWTLGLAVALALGYTEADRSQTHGRLSAQPG